MLRSKIQGKIDLRRRGDTAILATTAGGSSPSLAPVCASVSVLTAMSK